MGSLLARRIDEHVETRVKAGIEAGIEAGIARARAETLEQGLEQGLEWERALLSRQAARKFGAEAGAGLATLLAGVAAPDRLAEIGDLVVDCADGAELLARAQEEADRR